MDALCLPPDAQLPDDVGALQKMVRALLAELARLRAELAGASNGTARHTRAFLAAMSGDNY
jgi:hypothetical protein